MTARLALACSIAGAAAVPVTLGAAATAAFAALMMAFTALLNAAAARTCSGLHRRGCALMAVAFSVWALAQAGEANGMRGTSTLIVAIYTIGWAFGLGGLMALRNATIGGSREYRRSLLRSLRIEQTVLLAIVLFGVWQVALVPFRNGDSLFSLLSWIASAALGTLTMLLTSTPLSVFAPSHPLGRWPSIAAPVTIAADVAISAILLAGEQIDHRLIAGVSAVAGLLAAQAICHPNMAMPIREREPAAFLDLFRVAVLLAAVAAMPLVAAITLAISTEFEPRGLVVAGTVIAGGVALRLRSALRYANELRDTLHQRALADELTGLPNRRGLQERCSLERRAKSEDRTVSVLFVDLDGFKAVNDTLGHAAGDELLRQVAERLRANVRTDDVVARLGGDEFVVVGAYHRRDAGELGERLIAVLSAPFNIGGGQATISSSIGLAQQAPEELIDDTVSRADGAMYTAKRAGKGRLVHVA